VASGRELRTLAGHSNEIESVSFSPDGTMLASASWDLTIKLWEVGSGREMRALTGHTQWVQGVAFAPDGTLLASGANDSTVRLWGIP
jgi:WD40 repeat protein